MRCDNVFRCRTDRADRSGVEWSVVAAVDDEKVKAKESTELSSSRLPLPLSSHSGLSSVRWSRVERSVRNSGGRRPKGSWFTTATSAAPTDTSNPLVLGSNSAPDLRRVVRESGAPGPLRRTASSRVREHPPPAVSQQCTPWSMSWTDRTLSARLPTERRFEK